MEFIKKARKIDDIIRIVGSWIWWVPLAYDKNKYGGPV